MGSRIFGRAAAVVLAVFVVGLIGYLNSGGDLSQEPGCTIGEGCGPPAGLVVLLVLFGGGAVTLLLALLASRLPVGRRWIPLVGFVTASFPVMVVIRSQAEDHERRAGDRSHDFALVDWSAMYVLWPALFVASIVVLWGSTAVVRRIRSHGPEAAAENDDAESLPGRY